MQFQRNEAPDHAALHPIAFNSKSLTCAETQYSNTERGALGILYGLEKFHHYCFANKTLEDVAILAQRLQRILLHIHQYNIRIICKPGPFLFIADWLSRNNHNKVKDERDSGDELNITAIVVCLDISECMSAKEIMNAKKDDDHLYAYPPTTYMIHGWPLTTTEVNEELQPYWLFRDNIVVIDRIAMKGRRIIIPASLQ